MPEELLTIFKICLLILLYLFFFRVLRAVWTEVNAVASAPAVQPARISRRAQRKRSADVVRAASPHADVAVAASMPPAGVPPTMSATQPAVATHGNNDAEPVTLVAVDPPHLAGLTYNLTRGMTIGRGATASVVMDDSFLSQEHVGFDQVDGSWVVTDLNSTNGTYLNGSRLEQPTALRPRDRVQIGNIVLEAR